MGSVEKIAALGAMVVALDGGDAFAFTVQTAKTPAGHEVLVQRAVDEAEERWRRGDFPESALLFAAATADEWKRAKCGPECKEWARNVNVWGVVLGARWVDVAGFFVTDRIDDLGDLSSDRPKVDKVPLDYMRCWEVLTQLHDSVQHDHFLRKRTANEQGAEGWKATVEAAKARFESLFVSAVQKTRANPRPTVEVVERSLGDPEGKKYVVPEGLFLLGQAIHLLQDSFSVEHTTRMGSHESGDFGIADVRSQVCTPGARRHGFHSGLSFQFGEACVAASEQGFHGDIIWSSESESRLTNSASLAVIATREILAVFERALALNLQDVAKSNIFTSFVGKWFRISTTTGAVASGQAQSSIAACAAEETAVCETRSPAVVNGWFDSCLASLGNASKQLGRPAYDANWSRTSRTVAECVPIPNPKSPCTIPGMPGYPTRPGAMPEPANPAVIGSVLYYRWRYCDLLRRNPSATPPSYYLDYGEKYACRFSFELYPKLSPVAKTWLLKTRINLQRAIEDELARSPAAFEILERTAGFTDFAYATHASAYLNAGLANLAPVDIARIGDLAKIATTPDIWKDLITKAGLAQVLEVGVRLIPIWGERAIDWAAGEGSFEWIMKKVAEGDAAIGKIVDEVFGTGTVNRVKDLAKTGWGWLKAGWSAIQSGATEQRPAALAERLPVDARAQMEAILTAFSSGVARHVIQFPSAVADYYQDGTISNLNESFKALFQYGRALGEGQDFQRGCVAMQAATLSAIRELTQRPGSLWTARRLAVGNVFEHHAVALFRKGTDKESGFVLDPWIAQTADVSKALFTWAQWSKKMWALRMLKAPRFED